MSDRGYFSSRIYRSWEAMRRRCDSPAATGYERYGGLDITYDPAWKSFWKFVEDMGPMPEGFTLERKDGNGNYCKANCVWASYTTQARNRSSVKLSVEKALEIRRRYAEGNVTQVQLAREFGVKQVDISKVILHKTWAKELV